MRHKMKVKRPILVTLLAGYVFLLAGLNASAVVTAFVRIDVLRSLETTVPIWVLVVFRMAWASIWIAVLFGLLRRLDWAPTTIAVAYPVYQLLLILQWVFFVGGQYEQGRLAYVISYAVWSAALILYILTRQPVTQYLIPQPQDFQPEEPIVHKEKIKKISH